MLWQVRALLEDRPGALAALASSCGARNVNVLGLEIFPGVDGRVVDQLVLHTPGGWNAGDVARLCELAGVASPAVTPCSAHALEDQPVRWVRAAGAVAERPDRLEQTLARLLDAQPLDGLSGYEELVLDDGPGPAVRLHRRTPFTDTEVARATELRRIAARAPSPVTDRAVAATRVRGPSTGGQSLSDVWSQGSGAPPGAEQLVLRPGTGADVDAVVALHERCSAETVRRRYHAPVPSVSRRLARALLEPVEGASLVLVHGAEVVGLGVLAGGPDGPELGLMVEDRWQRQGHGSRMMRALALEAAGRGAETVTCVVEPDNDAVLHTIRRAGLRALVSYSDGRTQYKVLVARLAGKGGPRRRPNRPAMGAVTAGLVSLLHQRSDLREVYPPAAALDQAVRGGA
jgi:ribosomal protein S18 acetylase RimI-like enzyme